MPNRLTEAKINEVSFVSRPAEPNAVISFYKSDDDPDDTGSTTIINNTIEKTQPTASDVHSKGVLAAIAGKLGIKGKKKTDDEDELSEEELGKLFDDLISSEAERIAKEGRVSLTPEQSADEPNGGRMPIPEMESVPEEVKDYVTKLEAERDEAVAKTAELEKSAEGSGDDDPDDILKGADPRLAEMIRKNEERAERAESIAKAERSKRIEGEFIAKAESLTRLGEAPTTLGPLMKTISESVDEETFEALDTLLKAADAKLQESDLFVEMGDTGAGTTGDALHKLEALAKTIAERDGIEELEAFEKAMDENPKLYEVYMEEQVA